MGRKRLYLSEYHSKWLMAMFDLPVDTIEARREYNHFRKALLREGFTMLQFSVYARYCEREERGTAFRRRLKKVLPPDGEVRLISLTDRQFRLMEIFRGEKREPAEKNLSNYCFFKSENDRNQAKSNL